MNFTEFASSLENPESAYLIVSRQDYWVERVRQACLAQVPEAARSFDWNAFDLSEDDLVAALRTARTMPWLSARRWVFVRNADSGLDGFREYLVDPHDRTVLVLCVSRKPGKPLPAALVEMDGGRIGVAWIRERLESEGYTITSEAAETLLELVGDDLQRLDSEIEKLVLGQLDTKQVDLDAVLSVTVEAREREVFDLISALAQRKRRRALHLLSRLVETGTAAQQILPILYWNFSRLLVARELLDRRVSFYQILRQLKIWSYRGREREVRSLRRDVLEELLLGIREADRLCKTSGGEPRFILERLLIDTQRGRSV
jgi:DNA polymerase-3 subunit delta